MDGVREAQNLAGCELSLECVAEEPIGCISVTAKGAGMPWNGVAFHEGAFYVAQDGGSLLRSFNSWRQRRVERQMPSHDEMVRRQRVLADFGEFALRSEDIQEVLTEACRFIAEALGSKHAKILEIDRDNDTALVRAGVGWKPGIVGEMRIPLGGRSSEAYAIEVGQPVVMQDLSKEERFDIPEFMEEAGIAALVNVPIFVPGGEPYGLLQVDSREPREFGEEDTEFLRTYATILGPVIDRLHKVSDLRQAQDRNAILLRELQHRVKNDLAVIQMLVRLRARRGSPEVQKELQIVLERIDTLHLLHSQLYAGKADRVAVRPYVESLLENLHRLHADKAGKVRFDIEVAELEVSPDVAGPLGLILNEFTTNSFKYAFNGRDGVLTVRIERLGDERALLCLSDNGVGLSGGKPSSGSRTGMGLIDSLACQIGGQAQWSSQNGVRLRTEFQTS